MRKRLLLLALVLCASILSPSFLPALADLGNCYGWENCDTVYCPSGYAVRLPSGEYLPCENFEAYVNGDKTVAIGGARE